MEQVIAIIGIGICLMLMACSLNFCRMCDKWGKDCKCEPLNPQKDAYKHLKKYTMKPSERIKEIVYAQTGGGIGSVDVSLWAIAKYLDEQWEKEQDYQIPVSGYVLPKDFEQFTLGELNEWFIKTKPTHSIGMTLKQEMYYRYLLTPEYSAGRFVTFRGLPIYITNEI